MSVYRPKTNTGRVLLPGFAAICPVLMVVYLISRWPTVIKFFFKYTFMQMTIILNSKNPETLDAESLIRFTRIREMVLLGAGK